ncbi:MAG TPA: nucleotidyltransferase family protein [Polyangia bacterium]|nr:nucleotidyltransferase family protein [Polyangia bacterium]
MSNNSSPTAMHNLIIAPGASIRQAMRAIDSSGLEVALVCEDDGRLVAMTTDGDIRRALLAGQDLDAPAMPIARKNFTSVSATCERSLAVQIMLSKDIKCLPVVDDDGRLVHLHTLTTALIGGRVPSVAVVMAGGRGERLGELTNAIPKPMLPIGNRPILEHVVALLVSHGVRRIYLAINYFGSMISDHFGDGRRFHCDIDYLREHEPMGTAGALSLLPGPVTHPLIVMNGDLLTSINLSRMLATHTSGGFAATMAVHRHIFKVPYGVVQSDGERVMALQEKPAMTYDTNAGIYVLSPRTVEMVPSGWPSTMTALIESCLTRQLPVGAFHMDEPWRDIGLPAEFQAAQVGSNNKEPVVSSPRLAAV